MEFHYVCGQAFDNGLRCECFQGPSEEEDDDDDEDIDPDIDTPENHPFSRTIDDFLIDIGVDAEDLALPSQNEIATEEAAAEGEEGQISATDTL